LLLFVFFFLFLQSTSLFVPTQFQRILIAHYLAVVLGIIELAHLNKQGNVPRREGGEHARNIGHIDVAHSELYLFGLDKQIVDVGSIFILDLIVVELGDIFLAYGVYKEGSCKGEEREEGARGYNNGDVALGGVGVQNRLESKPDEASAQGEGFDKLDLSAEDAPVHLLLAVFTARDMLTKPGDGTNQRSWLLWLLWRWKVSGGHDMPSCW